MPFETFDRSRLKLLPLAERIHDLHYDVMKPAVFDNGYRHPTLDILAERIEASGIRRMVVTMGQRGAVYAEQNGEKGVCPSMKVIVKDVAGCGDAFFAGVTIGLTYGKKLSEACEIGTRLAASVIVTSENVCPRFQPSEFGLEL